MKIQVTKRNFTTDEWLVYVVAENESQASEFKKQLEEDSEKAREWDKWNDENNWKEFHEKADKAFKKLEAISNLISGRNNSHWLPKHRVREILEGRI